MPLRNNSVWESSRVAHPALCVVAGRVFGAGAELFAEEHVANAGCRQCRLQLFFAELRVEAAVRSRANIRECVDVVLLKQRDESVDRMFGVSDGVDHT
jgi:hypothetical protein